jgi:prophage regulatory protein
MNLELLKLPAVLKLRCRGRTAHYQDIQDGFFTAPIKLGKRAVAWPSCEVDAVLSARIAGRPDAEIKALVSRLHSARVGPAL